jgi:D-amino-acid dehydrogenase
MHPERADVVIVGGGIIGSCAAYYLARAGQDVVVLDPAPGAGSSKANAGIICASYCLTLPAPGQQLISGALMAGDEHVVISPSADYIRITSGMEFGAEGAPDPSPPAVARMRAAAERTVPALRELTGGGELWRGARPMTPTGVPFIGAVAPNVVAATGHNTMGMTLGPVTGQMVSDLITQQKATRRSA